MPKGYVIFTEEITDLDGMAAYSRASGASIAEAGAVVLAVDATPQVLEGEWRGRTVVLEFATVEAAREWYESPSYEKAKPLRQAASRSNGVLLTGFEMPSRPA